MVHREYGRVLVRVDDLTNDGQQMVEAATKLITDIKRRIGSAAGNSIFFATMVLVGAIIWMFKKKKWL